MAAVKPYKDPERARRLPKKRPHETKRDTPLTAKQRLFVQFHVEQRMTPSAAARMAGYTGASMGQTAWQLMRHPKIQKAIAELREEYAIASRMTKQQVIDGFMEAINMGRVMSDPVAMISGWREIGKMCGFYEPTKTKVEVSVEGKVLIERLNTMSDAELLQLAGGDKSVLEGEFHVVPD